MRRRDWIAGFSIALFAGCAVGLLSHRLAGTSIDLLFWLRERIAPIAWEPERSPAAVIAIDEETYRRPPFTNIPNALWTHEIADVLDALVEADAKVVGFDVIFPTSIDRFVPGFDRNFLLALHRAAESDRVVLGEVQHQKFPIHPFPAQSFAVGNERNIRSVNLFRDDDEVIRHVPLTFEPEAGETPAGARESSMALELAARAAGTRPVAAADGGLTLGRYAIAGSDRNRLTVNFERADNIPTFSLADLVACVREGKTSFFHSHFAGKVVLIGAVLDVEDRKLTSMRLITRPEIGSAAERCVLPPLEGLFREDVVRDSIPGVYVFATAVDNLLLGDALRELPGVATWSMIVALALLAAGISLFWPPPRAAPILALLAILWVAAATLAFRAGLVLPLLAPPIAAGLAYMLLLAYRFAVTDRDKRLLRASFGLYLPPTLVDRVLEQDKPPRLGGEMRSVTVMFSDIAQFTALSERLPPGELVALMNSYFSEMTAIIESEGGFVDKYIGDAIVAIFGTPIEDRDHALHGVRAALACRDRLDRLNETAQAFGGNRLGCRAGIATGSALVGNIGSRGRFNFTAMGDVVNLASRLESANKIYGTSILVSDAVREACGEAIDWLEVDRVRVMGKTDAVTILEPLGLRGETPRLETAARVEFAAALDDYRAGAFAAAADRFDRVAGAVAPARFMAERARHWLAVGAPTPWLGVTALESK
jgi:adenylate cyclase